MVSLSGIVSRVLPVPSSWGGPNKSESRAKSRAEFLKEKAEKEQEAKDLIAVQEYYAKWLTKQCNTEVNPKDLCNEVSDGVLLCTVVSKLTEQVGGYEEYPVTLRDKAKNLSIFLNACRSLDIPEESLFTGKDLKDKAVIPVARCLFALERKIEKRKKAQQLKEERRRQKEKEKARAARREREKQERLERQKQLEKQKEQEEFEKARRYSIDHDNGISDDEVITKKITTYDYDSDVSIQSGSDQMSDILAESVAESMDSDNGEEIIITQRSGIESDNEWEQSVSRKNSGVSEPVNSENQQVGLYDVETKEDVDSDYYEEKQSEISSIAGIDDDSFLGDSESELTPDSEEDSLPESIGDTSKATAENNNSTTLTMPGDLFSEQEQRAGDQDMFMLLDQIFGKKAKSESDIAIERPKEQLSNEVTNSQHLSTENMKESADRFAPPTPVYTGVQGSTFPKPKPLFSARRRSPRMKVSPSSQQKGGESDFFKLAQSIQRKYQSDSDMLNTSYTTDFSAQLSSFTSNESEEVEDFENEIESILADKSSKPINTSEIAPEPEEEIEPAEQVPRMESKETAIGALDSNTKESSDLDGQSAFQEADATAGANSDLSEKKRTAPKESTVGKASENHEDKGKHAEVEDSMLFLALVGLVVMATMAIASLIVLEVTGVVDYGVSEALGLVQPKQSTLSQLISYIVRV